MNLLLPGSLLLFHRDTLSWLARFLQRDDLQLNLFVVAGLLAALASLLRARPGVLTGRSVADLLRQPPRLRPLPVAALAASVLLPLITHRIADIDLLDAACLGIGLWALGGLWIAPRAWARQLPLLLLLLGLLPFEVWVDAYIGFPARTLTASIVADLLSQTGISLDQATVLKMDGPRPAFAHIDVPCAGVRSLWTGTMTLLALAAIRGSIHLRLIALLPLCWGLLFFANLLRVLALIVAGAVIGSPELADRMHTPLGLLGFTAAMGVVVGLMGRGEEEREGDADAAQTRKHGSTNGGNGSGGWGVGVVCAGLLGAAAVDRPAVEALEPVGFGWAAPEGWAVTGEALSEVERAFFAGVGLVTEGAEAPGKYRFLAGGGAGAEEIAGSLILVPATRWRAHHLPEHCQAPLGIGESRVRMVAPGLDVRQASAGQGRWTLVWWFEAPDRRTHDLFNRAWADITGAQDRWVMASLLIDNFAGDLPDGRPPTDSALDSLISDLARSLRAGFSPVTHSAIHLSTTETP